MRDLESVGNHKSSMFVSVLATVGTADDSEIIGKKSVNPRRSSGIQNWAALNFYSHSIVPGGLLVMSYTTRLTPLTSLMIRVAVSPKNFISNE
jgi:hypothetical protein